jgi:RNA polymerase sigma-70 factor (ECF subfamily)
MWNFHLHFISQAKPAKPVAEQYQHMTDQQLLQLYRGSGQNVYAGILLQRYSLLLFGVCMKYLKQEEEAKDAVQQVLIKALHELGKYEVTYVKSWLYTIARNYCLMELRKTKRLQHTDDMERLPGHDHDPLAEKLERHQQEQLMAWVEQALQQLQEPQRQCVTLFYLQKKSYQQIADQTGHSLMQVKSAIQNGKRNIKIWVDKQRQRHAS